MYEAPALKRRVAEVFAEYDAKKTAIGDALKAFNASADALKTAATVGGTWGNVTIDTGHVYESTLETSLLKSAWRHIYSGLSIDRLASADDKRRFERAMENPPPFTVENIRATFGHFILDPRGNILRGLAEVFCALDPFYKSHDRVKIGVAGLPKRVVISSVRGFSSYGQDKLRDIFNALAAVRGQPLVEHREFEKLDKLCGYFSQDAGEVVFDGSHLVTVGKDGSETKAPNRGITVRKFKNANAHVIFDGDALRDINLALAEFYGDVLPDCSEEKPDKPAPGTAVAKDLQFYPTPAKVVDHVLDAIYDLKHANVLEPSCGDGAIMRGMLKRGATPFGIEVDPARAAMARAAGFNVLTANFLEVPPDRMGSFDLVVMNPPFYGKHYAKHVTHALKFLKPGGALHAILPATARYDHGLLDGEWEDLPVGSFSESGTNINTTILRIRKEEGSSA